MSKKRHIIKSNNTIPKTDNNVNLSENTDENFIEEIAENSASEIIKFDIEIAKPEQAEEQIEVAVDTEIEEKPQPKAKSSTNWVHFTKGLIKENPTLVGLLGMCPTLAITTMAGNGIGMGLATTFVLVCSNLVISLLKNIVPKAVRLPSFIVVIAGFVTFVGFILKGYVPALNDALGIYLPLITVNCIILGRAEVFASKNKVIPSILDGLGMGFGFTLALFTMGTIREILGSGSWMGMKIPALSPMLIFIMPAGGFFVLGCIIAAVNKIANKKPPQELGCHACPNSASCSTCKEKGGLQ